MSDYIRRDAVIKWVESWLNMDRYFRPNGEHNDIPITELYALLKQIPAVDAVPVVRCKDCKHFVISEGVCSLLSNNYEPPVYCGDEDFCSLGRRKERKGGDEG